MSSMFIVGHRGARALAPENTLAAIGKGIRCADYIEVDTRLSSDGVPVIMHDESVDRTTSGTGDVHSFTVHELSTLDA